MYAGPPLDLLERDLSDSQVSSAHLCYLVLLGLLYKAQPKGCQHRFTDPAETKALPHEGALALLSAHYAPVQAQGSSTIRFKACSGFCLL